MYKKSGNVSPFNPFVLTAVLYAVEDLWDENLGEILAINPEAPLPEEPVAEDEASQVVNEEEPDMPIN